MRRVLDQYRDSLWNRAGLSGGKHATLRLRLQELLVGVDLGKDRGELPIQEDGPSVSDFAPLGGLVVVLAENVAEKRESIPAVV